MAIFSLTNRFDLVKQIFHVCLSDIWIFMSRLTHGWKEFRKMPYVFQVLSAPPRAIFRSQIKKCPTQ